MYGPFLGSCRTIHRIYIKGVKRAEYECKNRFTNERWNCPELFVQLQNSLHESTNPTNTIFMSRKYFLSFFNLLDRIDMVPVRYQCGTSVVTAGITWVRSSTIYRFVTGHT